MGVDSKKYTSTRGAEKVLAQIYAQFRQHEIDRDKMSLSNQALRILKKKTTDRTDLDVESIVDEMSRQVWLDRLPEEVRVNREAFKAVLNVMTVAKYEVPEVPVEVEGDPMETMYMVLSGSLLVHPSKKDIAREEQRKAERGGSSKETTDALRPRRLVPGDVIGEDFWKEDVVWENEFYCSQGGAIILTIGKTWYERAMRPHMQEAHKARAVLLKKCYPFSNQEPHQCEALAALMQFRTYPCNTTIIKQGDIPTDLFFILKGHCRVVKEMMMSADELKTLRKPVNPLILSHMSSSPSPWDAKRKAASSSSGNYGISGQSSTASFRSAYFREGENPSIRAPQYP